MTAVVRRRLAARQDLIDVYRYYAREAGIAVARNCLTESEAAFVSLARAPFRFGEWMIHSVGDGSTSNGNRLIGPSVSWVSGVTSLCTLES